MRLTIRHVYDFGKDAAAIGDDLVSPDAWDIARDTSGPFGLPRTREDWIAASESAANIARAADIAAIVRGLGAESLCSHGVGTGLLEYQLHRNAPEVRLTCTDFAPRTVERLRQLFPEAHVVQHDLTRDPPPKAGAHLLHRIDTELPQRAWQDVFARLDAPVLLVPAVLLDTKTALKAIRRRLVARGATRAGWCRNEASLRDLWHRSFDDEIVTVGGERAFLLHPR